MRILIALAFGLVSFTLGAQTTNTYDDLGEFAGLRASSAFDVDVVLGEVHNVEVTVPDKLADRLDITVDDGVLNLGLGKGGPVSMRGNQKLRATVTLPMLESVDASGAADVSSESVWVADDFAVHASGAAEVELRIEVGNCAVSSSGASDVDLAGSAGTLVVDASGASDVDASEVLAVAVTVSSSGASDVDVHATESITATASGGSDITYAGEATQVSVDASGGSDISGPRG